ncbi:penicillin-binding transpeptidase domain-containing protein [Paenibacillus sp. PK4536]|uniref:penicillin-binding protein PBP4(5) n=1 Tax=Paenibacillus sp. PK4536 TaxID=3024576 RepID=UPI002358ED1F|nr:penicillin-binding transpeptidase domain-containing protein [Paenibacillus sp. PK4536]WIM40580.1 penicillin-binding transpeptidase domain-containing protein [Paenibacillus sp. PK4536]
MKTKHIIIYGLLSFLIASGLGLYVYMQSRFQEQPDTTIQKYINTLQTQNYDELYNLMTPESLQQSGMTKEQFVQKYKLIFDGMKVSTIEVNAGAPVPVPDDKHQYTLNYSAQMNTFLGNIDPKYQLKLIQQDSDHGKTWRIQWQPSLILPEMEKGDKVKVQILHPERGEILDKDGYPLATKGTIFEWGIVPGKLGTDDTTKAASMTAISEYYNVPEATIEKALGQSWVKDDYFVPIGTTTKPDIPTELHGVSMQTKEVRTYPLGTAAAHLIGYVRQTTAEDLEKDTEGYYSAQDWIGKAGLEQSMEKQLRGTKGGRIEIVNEAGKSKSVIAEEKEVNGENITLTISSSAQRELYTTMASDQDAGSAVLMNPTNGKLLALVSTPAYDPNQMVTGLSQAEWDAYSNDPNLPFTNRFTNRYAPGSVFKAITAAAGLTEKVTTPDKVHTIQGLQWRKDNSWGGYYVTRVKDVLHVNMNDALMYSDNIYFAQEAVEMGKAKFIEGIQKFGFDTQFGLDALYLKPSQYANKDHLALDSEVLLADTAYGQGEMLMSPIHLAASFTPFITEGTLISPILFENQALNSATPANKRIITPEVADTVKNALLQVVSNSGGTAHALADLPYQVAAKTGTAELKLAKGEQGQENGFVITFDTKSSFVLAAVIEKVNGRGGSHYVVNKLHPFLQQYR